MYFMRRNLQRFYIRKEAAPFFGAGGIPLGWGLVQVLPPFNFCKLATLIEKNACVPGGVQKNLRLFPDQLYRLGKLISFGKF